MAKVFARLVSGPALAYPRRLVSRRRNIVAVARQPGRVGHHVMAGDRAVLGMDREPWQVARNGLLWVELTLLMQLQQRDSGERLGNRADFKQRIRCDRLLALHVGIAI